MFAILETGGKQYRVLKDSVFSVEKLEAQVGDQLSLDCVMMVSSDGNVTTGKPFIEGSSVKVTVLDQMRGKKIRVFKMKRRKRYRRTQGHRQYLTKLRVDDIQVS